MRSNIFFLFLFLLLTYTVEVQAQNIQVIEDPDSAFVVIDDIRIEGNRRTKKSIITRELDIAPHDTIPASRLKAILTKNKNKVFNTGLFVAVEMLAIDTLNDTSATYRHQDIVLQVKERWYTFPSIIFELADRNFNEWWTDRNRDLRRTDYGVRFHQQNFRGRNEDLKFVLQGGFTKKFELSYNIPYINRKQQSGLRVAFSYSTNKNVAYKTFDNKLIFASDEEETLRSRLSTGITYNRRVGYYNFSSYELKYNRNTISEVIAGLNPDYFLHGRTDQQYFSLRYSFVHDKRDIRAYPLSGQQLTLEAEQTGLLPSDDVFITRISGRAAYFKPLGKEFFIASELSALTSFSPHKKQPYSSLRALGYGQQLVRGYEYYVVDGQHYGLMRNSLRRRLFNTKQELRFIPLKQFQSVPIAMYVKAYLDAGYVHNSSTASINPRFSNRLMAGGGLGIDLVTYYDAVFRLEYSINKAGETGFFIHFSKDI
jgi:outer membrane protein assembly factor BamA